MCIVYVKDNDYLIEDRIELEYINVGTDKEEFKATLDINESQYKDKYGYDFLVYEFEVSE